MANNITLTQKFMPIIDEVYKLSSLTAGLDAKARPVDFGGAAEVKVYRTSVSGLGNYSRDEGYTAGKVTGSWQTLTLGASRGQEFTIDRMDDDETLGMAFGATASEFMRLKVVPEIDAYRFYKYASASGIHKVSGALTADNILDEIDAAQEALDTEEAPADGRILFIGAGAYKMLKGAVVRAFGGGVDIERGVKTLDDMRVVVVPQSRFYTAIELCDGVSAGQEEGGYVKAAGAKNINFMLLHEGAVLQAIKHASLKVFDPDVNQTSDAYKIQYRLYHDAFVLGGKAGGVYLHAQA